MSEGERPGDGEAQPAFDRPPGVAGGLGRRLTSWSAPLRSALLAPFFALAGGTVGSQAVTPNSDQVSDASAPLIAVELPYLTNRRVEQETAGAMVYGGGRGEPRQGRCRVQFAPIPLLDDLASSAPFYVPSETLRVRAVEEPDSAAFWEDLASAAAGTATGSVVLFIHGYSNGFDRGCRMAAEMQRALAGQAVVLLFSWPSPGQPLDYARDQAALEWSVPLLAETLVALYARLGAERIRILAHSLGSRGAIFALEWLDAEARRPVTKELVLLAPDFDAQAFLAHLPRLKPLSGAITLYASELDTPLKVSQQVHGYPRLGQGGALRTVVAGVETIDVSPAGRYQLLGHEYFYRHPRVQEDLVRLLTKGERAGQRPGLRPQVHNGLAYWEIPGRNHAQPRP